MVETDFLIVGAGISGLTSALTLLRECPDAKVTIIDSAAEAGGLLRSVNLAGLSFDFGTHIPELTANTELNNLLFPPKECAKWRRLTELKTGNYFAGQLNHQSQFLDITKAENLFLTALYELLQTTGQQQEEYANLEIFCRQRYGDKVTDQIFAPLMLKFTGEALNVLSAKAPAYYGLSRLIYGDRNCAVNLKKINAFDEILAFAADAEKPRSAQWLYPPAGEGIGSWISLLAENVAMLGGNFSFNNNITGLKYDQGKAYLHTSQGSLLARYVIWTVPVYLGLNGIQQSRSQSRAISLFHFYSQVKPLTDKHYIYCYDSMMQSYRITFYDNIQQSDKAALYRCSVEVIVTNNSNATAVEIAEELVAMGLYSNANELSLAGNVTLSAGFPIPKAGEEQKRLELFEQVKLHNPEVVFCGRGKPQVFFMTDVLMDTYTETLALLAKSGLNS